LTSIHFRFHASPSLPVSLEVSLQFDGVTDDVYVKIRGQPLLSTKLQAIENAKSAGLCVSVAATLLPQANTTQIGDIIQFAKEHRLDGVNLAPMKEERRLTFHSREFV